MKNFDELTTPSMNRNWGLVSWATPFIALVLTAILLSSSIGRGQGRDGARSPTGQMVCTISSFFSFDANDGLRDILVSEGRGLANCRNDQGFATEFPVSMSFEAAVVGSIANSGELSFSANSAPFTVSREVSQLQDKFEIRTYARASVARSAPALLLRGLAHDLAIQMSLATSTDAFEKIQLRSLTVAFDENAPTLE